MVTMADTSWVSAAEAAPDAARRYLDELADASRAYFAAWSALQLATVRATFDLENLSLQAYKAMLDGGVQAGRGLLDQWADARQRGQSATVKLMASGAKLMEPPAANGRV